MPQIYNSPLIYLTQTVNNAPQTTTLIVPAGAIISNLEITTTQAAAPGLVYYVQQVNPGGTGSVIFNRLASSTPTLISGVRDVLVTPDSPLLLGENVLGFVCTQASANTTHMYVSYKCLNQNGMNFSPNYIQSSITTVSADNTAVLTVPSSTVYKILSIYSTAAVHTSSKISCFLTQSGVPTATTPFCEATLTGVAGPLLQTGSSFSPFFMQEGQVLNVSAANYPVNITITYMVVS